MDVIEHGSGRVGIVRNMDRAAGQLPHQPAVHGAEKELSCFRPIHGSRYMVQNPLDFRGGKIGIGDQAGGFPDVLPQAPGNQAVHNIGGPPALPDNGIVHRLSRLFVPDNGSLPLVGDANGRNLPGIHTGLGHHLHHDGILAGPDFHGIVLHPAVMGIELGKLLLAYPQDILFPVKEDGPGAGGTLVQGKDIVSHSQFSFSMFRVATRSAPVPQIF